MIKPATAWYRQENEEWKYNHYEIGISGAKRPTPESEPQQQWKNQQWAKKYGYYQHALGRTELTTETELIGNFNAISRR